MKDGWHGTDFSLEKACKYVWTGFRHVLFNVISDQALSRQNDKCEFGCVFLSLRHSQT